MEKLRGRRGSHESLYVLGAFLLALSLRLLSAKNALVGGDLLFYGYDSFYHMRRILYTAENFPSTLWFDSYLNHPSGLNITWPPLFDQVVAGASLLLGGGPRAAEMTGALAPAVLGSGAVLIIYLLGKKIFGARVAILSAFILAADPKHIARTHFGCIDHDALESLLIFGAILLLAYALTDEDRRVWLGAGAGVLLAAAAYAWLGTPIYMGAILVYAAIQVALDLRDGVSAAETIAPLAAAFGVALLLILPYHDEAWLFPSFLGALGGLSTLAALLLLSRLFAAKRISWLAYLPAVAILGYLAAVLSYTGWMGSILWQGINYFFMGGLAEESIIEAAPLYQVEGLVSLPGLGFAFSLLGFFILIPEACRSRISRDRALFLVFAAFTLLLTIFQVRFLYLFSVAGSLLTALLFFWCSRRLRSLGPPAPSTASPLPIALLVILILPNAAGLLQIADERPEIEGDWVGTLDWLEDNSPATTGFERPVQPGEYAVLSWWDYGNWILYKSRRPVVANNFQAGATEAARFFLSEDEEEALAIAEERDVRYVITDEKMVYSKLPAIVRWTGEDPDSYVAIAAGSDADAFHHSNKFLATVLARLHLRDCTDLGGFRLVRESETVVGRRVPTSEVKVFERVAGAKIAGTTPYDKPIGVALEIMSNQGRRFEYFNSAMPVDGRYEVTVPYSTDKTLETHALGPYLVGPVEDFVGGDFKEVEVSEEDVIQGRVIEVDF